jgi:hypothetical protein
MSRQINIRRVVRLMSATRDLGYRDEIGRLRDRRTDVMPKRQRSWLVCAVVAFSIAGCSSGDASGPSTEPPVSPASTSTTIVDVTTSTSVPEETAPPATTSAPTTVATSTTAVPVPSAGEPIDPLSEEAASAEVQRLFDLWTECLGAMPDCDPLEVSSNYVGEYRNFVFLQASSWSEEGFTIENTASRQNRVESVSIVDGVATVIACEDNGTVLINGEGVVVDDVYESARVEWTLVSDGSRWLGSDLVDLEVAEGEDNALCDE